MMAQDLSCRSHQPEMMDGDAISFEDFQNYLHDLELVNVLTRGRTPTVRKIEIDRSKP
jgi:hypothetical protein